MKQQSAELRAAIDVAKERIKVDTYYPRAMNAGLKGNAQGFWAGTALGFLTGGAAGGLISLALFMVNPASALIGWPLVLGVASIGGTMGGATGARIGAGSGAIAGVAAERERRDKAEKLEQEILQSPEKQREVIEAYRKDPVVEKNDTVKEIYATTRGKGKAFNKLLDWPSFFVAVAICTVASMALFGGAFMIGGGLAGTAVASGLGALGMTSMSSALAIGAAAGAVMGAAFGIAYPPIFATLTKHTGDLLSHKMVRGESGFAHIKSIPEIEREAAHNRAISENHPATSLRVAASEAPGLEVSDAALMERVKQPEHQLTA